MILSKPHFRQTLWLSLASATILQCCIGIGSGFGVWSGNLKDDLGLTQSELATVASFKDLGVSLGVIAGLFADSLPPSVILMVGGLLNMLGYLMLWLSLEKYIPVHGVWEICIFAMIGSHGSNWLNTAGMVTMVKNFRHHSGFLIGYMKGFIGLSAAIFVQLYWATLYPNTNGFLLLAALIPPLVAACVSPFITLFDSPAYPQGFDLSWQFLTLGGCSAILALYVFSCSLIRQSFDVSKSQNLLMLVGTVLLLSLPFFLVFLKFGSNGKLDIPESSTRSDTTEQDSTMTPLKDPESPMEENESFEEDVLGKPHSFLSGIKRVEFWLLFISMMMGCGSALAVADNLGQICSVLGFDQSIAVSLYSVMSFFGFMIGGYASEFTKTMKILPRTCFGLILFPLLAISHLVLSFGTKFSVYGGTMFVGFCFGSMWAISPAILGDLLGFKAYASLYNLLIVANPVGSYILSVQIVGRLFDQEAMKGGNLGLFLSDRLQCSGKHCFQIALWTLSGFSVIATIVWLCLFLRTKTFYKKSNAAERLGEKQ